MTEARFNSYSESEFGYSQLFGILARRWIWFASAFTLGLAGGIYMAVNQQSVYVSSMQLLVEPNLENDITQADLKGTPNARVSDADYATQLNLMRSDQFIHRAVNLLNSQYPDLTNSQAKQAFSLTRVVERDGRNQVFTRIFEASYASDDPVKSQKFLEAIKQVYLDYNQERQSERLSRGLQYTDERLYKTRNNLISAQRALEEFRQRENLIDPSQQAEEAVQSLSRVEAEQRQLLSDLDAARNRYRVLQQQIALPPESAKMAARLSQSSRIQTWLNTIQKTKLDLANRRVLFTDQDAEVQRLTALRDSQLAELRQEVASITQQPEIELDSSTLSLLQLSEIDLKVIADLIETKTDIAGMNAKLQSLEAMKTKLRATIDDYPKLIAEYDRLQPSVEIERNTLQQLLIQREQISAELARGGFTWDVILEPAMGDEISGSSLRLLVMGAIVGIFMGSILAFLRESMDKVVHTSDDLKKQVHIPLLGILPSLSQRRFSLPTSVQSLTSIDSLHPEFADNTLAQTFVSPLLREPLDLIANTLQLLQSKCTPQAIMVTSGLQGEGKTTLTLGLALSFARMNQRVLIIDADLRRSGIQRDLALELQASLSTFLQGPSNAIQPQQLNFDGKSVHILPAGMPLNDPITLLSSFKFERLLRRVKERYDIILVDTPPILGMADALKVGVVCDGAVLVTQLDRITQQELDQVLAVTTPIKILGIVANGARDGSVRQINYGGLVHTSA